MAYKRGYIFFCIGMCFISLNALSSTVLSETSYNLSPDLRLIIENYVRLSGNNLGNNLDLNSSEDDGVTYVGYSFNTRFNISYKEFFMSFLKLESNGTFDYDAPIVSDNKINTLFGDIDNYSFPEIIPRVEEYWVDSKIFDLPVRVKIGQYAYLVGNGYVLGGYYENYGISVYSTNEDLKWTVYYYKPDLSNKIILGPQVPQDRELGVKYDSNAHFMSVDTIIKMGDYSFQPYIGLLHDTTSSDRRNNAYPVSVNEDNLGTIGIDMDVSIYKWNFGFEAAKNFGMANVRGDGSDIIHKGYMVHADASYSMDKFTPRSKILVSSGHKMDKDDVLRGEFNSHSNRSFSTYSPTNFNLVDSVYQVGYGPYVATGRGYAANYGIARPGIFGDPYQLSDLILPNLGMDVQITEKLTVSIDYWYLRSFEHAHGTWNDRVITLSSDLGHELDFYSSYELTDNISFNLLMGIFFPGKYYREKRDDGNILGLAPSPRYDGDADAAYQIELSTEIIF